jgi:hypothetical protein
MCSIRSRKETVFLKIIRLARLTLALTSLSLGLSGVFSPLPTLAAPAAPAPAQSGLPPGAPPLTPAQQQQQQARINRFMQDRNALVANTSLSPAQKQQKYADLLKAFQQDMLNILTPKQRAMVTAQNAKVIDLRKQFATQHKAEIDELNQLTTKLAQLNTATNKALTAQQKQKMTKIQQDARDQLQKLQAENSTPAVKQATSGAIVRDADRQAFSILTPAQQAPIRQLQTKIVALQTRLGKELAAFAKAHGTQ